MPPTRRLLATFLTAVATLAATVIVASGAGAARPDPGGGTTGFNLVAAHPWAASQATADGRRLVELAAFEGRIYAGYGDYTTNTGPVAVAGLDPATATFTHELTADTEAIHTMRELNGRLFAPATDPRVAADFSASGPWADHDVVDATHVFDMVTTGTDLWMVGSSGYDAVAWRSLDGGATWTEALRVPPVEAAPADFARFYVAGILGGSLYVHAVDYYGGPHDTALAFDGTSWSAAPSLLGRGEHGTKAIAFAGRLVYSGGRPGEVGTIHTFDGTRATNLASAVDVEVGGDTLYLLDSRGNVTSTTDLETWTTVAKAPRGSVSLTVLDGRVYVGTAGSEIYAAPIA